MAAVVAEAAAGGNATGGRIMIEQDYEIESVRPAEPPSDMDGSDWHCYVITQGNNRIRGFRRGQPRAVMTAVEEIVSRLNERRMGKRGRVHLIMPSSKKPASK